MNAFPIEETFRRFKFVAFLAAFSLLVFSGCSNDSDGEDGTDTDTQPGPGGDDSDSNENANGSDSDNNKDDHDSDDDTNSQHNQPTAEMYPELWYSADNQLVNVQLSEDDGSVQNIVSYTIDGLGLGQNSLTMMKDGSLVGARLVKETFETELYYLAEPPRSGDTASYEMLGIMIDGIMLEALYTDCDGNLYGMDTGVDDGGSEGNQLIRFVGDFLAGDFSYVVVSDWSQGDVADIDDMGPGISESGEITDNDGFAIDTSTIYAFNYEEGQGTAVGAGGTWGIHALGGPLFTDDTSRLYVMTADAVITQIDPVTFDVIGEEATGPTVENGNAGWSGLAGPLTDCVTQFTVPE
ncbi:MAG: hypothetical protein JXX29_12430 [Deltaproteobacteria bacterium]|nr:hypothetical protein [Deltaproteobacteria bacterium]MBN2672481.1 hypothetical protein [Deltaproteobacteria bacterium]